MTSYFIKVKHILPTFLTVVFGTVFGLALIRWLFTIQFHVIDIKEEVWELWLPLIFPWIPITLWLRQKIRILSFKSNEDRRRFLFQIIAWGTMVAMLVISQRYLTTATGKLETLATIKEINEREKARYYRIAEYSVAPYYGGSFTDFRTSGKYNQHLNFDIYFVTPILSDTTERITGIPKNWYGVKFSEEISNRISPEEKENKYLAFYDACVAKMNNYNYHALDHFERKPNSDSRRNFLNAIEARIGQESDASFVVLEPRSEPYESRNGNKFIWIFGSFGIGLTTFLLLLGWPRYSRVEYLRHRNGEKPKHDDIVDMLRFLIPKGDHFATSIMLNLIIVVFLLMVFSGVHIISPNGSELLEWGANRRVETTGGEWWRLITSLFLHGGIMHLFLNIAGLVIAALFIEPVIGRKDYFILYFTSGVIGGLASVYWYENSVTVGASGAIFGLYGAILGLLLTDAFPKESKRGNLIIIGTYIFISLLWGLTGGIDNAAHIGGLVSGATVGVILYKMNGGRKRHSAAA
jgi:rhomboid protease GluP